MGRFGMCLVCKSTPHCPPIGQNSDLDRPLTSFDHGHLYFLMKNEALDANQLGWVLARASAKVSDVDPRLTVSLALALNPTTAPELLMTLGVVQRALSPGPLKVTKL